MNAITQRFTGFGLCIALTGALTTTAIAAETAAFPGALATITVGDIQGMLDNAGALAEKVSPGMNASMLKMQVGMILDDPKLEVIPPGSGILAVYPEGGMPFGFVELSGAKAPEFLDMLTSRGLSNAKVADGLYALGISPDAAKEAAEKHGKAAALALKGKGEPTLAGTVEVAKLLKKYKEPIEETIKTFPEKMAKIQDQMSKSGEKANTQAAEAGAKMMPMVFQFYYALAKRIESVRFTIRPSKAGVQIDKSIKPVGGLSPAKKGTRTGNDMLKLLPGGGTMDFEATYDATAVAESMIGIMDEVAKESTDPAKFADLSSWLKSYLGVSDGAMAGRMTVADGKMGGTFAIGVTDEAKARTMLSEIPAKMKASGLLGIYESLGIKCDFTYKSDAREHSGVKIDEMAIKLDAGSTASAEMVRAMSVYGSMQYDIAVVNKVLIYSSTPKQIDALIDEVKKGATADAKSLVSQSKLPSGGCFYADYNIGKVMELSMAALPPDSKEREAMGKLFSAIADYPLLFAGYHKTDTLDFTMLIPAELMKAAAEGIGQMAAKRNESFKEGIETTATVSTP